MFALHWPRELLVERINERVEAMIEAGALNETRALVEQFGDDAPALGSVGYKQLRTYLKRELKWEEACSKLENRHAPICKTPDDVVSRPNPRQLARRDLGAR